MRRQVLSLLLVNILTISSLVFASEEMNLSSSQKQLEIKEAPNKPEEISIELPACNQTNCNNKEKNIVSSSSHKISYISWDENMKYFIANISSDGSNKKITDYRPEGTKGLVNHRRSDNGIVAFTAVTPVFSQDIYIKRGKDLYDKVIPNAQLQDISSDGASLLYTNSQNELYAYDISSKKSFLITKDLNVFYASWSNDSQIIAASVWEKNNCDLYLIQSKNPGKIRRLTATEKENEQYPSFSKDNKTILYVTNRYGKDELEFMSLDENKPSGIRPAIYGRCPSLSPDNKQVAWQEAGKIYISDLNGYNVRFIAQGFMPIWIKESKQNKQCSIIKISN